MKFFKIVVTSIVTVILLPFLAHAKLTDMGNSSKQYCNIIRYFPRTSIDEVSFVITDAVAGLNNTCNENKVVSTKFYA